VKVTIRRFRLKFLAGEFTFATNALHMVSYILAVLHLLTFGLGFGSCWARGVALKNLKDPLGLPAVFLADGLWGVSALLWIGTGLWRAFGSLEKGSDYYLGSTAFLMKMGLFILIVLLEIKPAITFTKWRIQQKKGETIDLTPAASLSRLTFIELALLVPIVMLAAAMARGLMV
jgi:putative membrane protein